MLKRDDVKFNNFSNILNSLIEMKRTDKCKLFYFNKSGFSHKSNLPYCWGAIGVQSLRSAHSHNKPDYDEQK